MKKIVSGNWRDGRRGDTPWLLRDADQHPDQGKAVSTVYATGVIFCPSSRHENGFGCTIVGLCKTAVDEIPDGVMKRAVPLTFSRHRYGFLSEDRLVSVCAELILQADGKIFAVQPADSLSETAGDRETVHA